MATRGRQSAAALAVVPFGPKARPEPLPNLTPEQAEIWRQVTATKPPEWFTADTWPLLADYCRLTLDADTIESCLLAMGTPTGPEDVKVYRDLIRLRVAVAGGKAQLATKMRLAQQSRYNEQKADTLARHAVAGTKPWQRSGSGS